MKSLMEEINNAELIIDEDLKTIQFKRLKEEGVCNYFIFKPYNFHLKKIGQKDYDDNINLAIKNLHLNFTKIVNQDMQHTANVRVVSSDNVDDNFVGVDGLITNLKGIALALNPADCIIILLYDKKNKVIGAIHAGWRGTLNRIVEKAVKLMIATYNSNPSDIEVYFEPSILKCCFEVDEDVATLFEKEFPMMLDLIVPAKPKYFIDTVAINTRLLINLGVREENIVFSNICTKCHGNYIHSLRFDKESSGRNLALIYMPKS